MSGGNGKVLDLRALQNQIAGKIELNEGVHDVRKFTADQYQLAIKPALDPAENVERAVRLVLECVPTLAEAQVRKFDAAMLTAICTLASQGVAAVEQMFPNAASPEPPTSPG